MTNLTKIMLVVMTLTLAACAKSPLSGGLGDGQNGSDSAGYNDGSVNDPTSIAYFNQNIGDRVLFEVDQSTLNDQARSLLGQQAAWMNSNPDYAVLVEGHADEQGTRAYNLALGDRRAAAAREYLVSQGVSSARLRTVSYGKERPLEICSEEACYSQNRRAVIVLSGGANS